MGMVWECEMGVEDWGHFAGRGWMDDGAERFWVRTYLTLQ